MAEEKDQNGGAWSKVPTWDAHRRHGGASNGRWCGGRALWIWSQPRSTTWRHVGSYVLRQSGVVRQRCEEFTPQELAYQKEVCGRVARTCSCHDIKTVHWSSRHEECLTKEAGPSFYSQWASRASLSFAGPVWRLMEPCFCWHSTFRGPDPGDGQGDVVLTAEDPLSGLKKLMKALEGINGRTDLDKKGELRNQFYIDCKRRPDLRTEGVTLPTGEVGWLFKQKLGLDALRLQLLETALAGAEGFEETEREVLRLFKDVRSQDPLARKVAADGNRGPPLLNRFLNQSSTASRPSSYAPSTASSAPRSFRSTSSAASQRSSQPFRKFGSHQKQAMVSEVEENEPAEADEHDPEVVEDETDLAEVLKCEAEALAAELDDAAELGIDAERAETLQEVEGTVENAAEALVTMKEARTKLAEVKRDRGYGRATPVDDKSNRIPRSRRAIALTVAYLVTGLATRSVASRVRNLEESRKDCWGHDHRALCERKPCCRRRSAWSFDSCRPALAPISGGCCRRVSHEAQRGELGCHWPHSGQKICWCVGLHATAPALALIGFMVTSKVCKMPLKRSKTWCNQSLGMRRFILETAAPRFLRRDGGRRPSLGAKLMCLR